MPVDLIPEALHEVTAACRQDRAWLLVRSLAALTAGTAQAPLPNTEAGPVPLLTVVTADPD